MSNSFNFQRVLLPQFLSRGRKSARLVSDIVSCMGSGLKIAAFIRVSIVFDHFPFVNFAYNFVFAAEANGFFAFEVTCLELVVLLNLGLLEIFR